MLWANRNGFVYVLDRVTGEFLLGKAFVKQNWNLGLRQRPAGPDREGETDAGGHAHRARHAGRHELVFPLVQPAHGSSLRVGVGQLLGDLEICRSPAVEPKARIHRTRPAPAPGAPARGRAGVAYRTETEGYGAVRAIDPKTGDKKWDFKMVDYTESGVLTTASDLLFSGGREGHFFALDARTGELLWRPISAATSPAVRSRSRWRGGSMWRCRAKGHSMSSDCQRNEQARRYFFPSVT